MANSSTIPPNVALEKIAQLLNNIVDESKLASMFPYGHTWYSVVVFNQIQRNHVKICTFEGTLTEDLNDAVDTSYVRKRYILSHSLLTCVIDNANQ